MTFPGDDVPIEELQAEALAGEADWVWAMVRLRPDGSFDVSRKIQRRAQMLLGGLLCMWVGGATGLVLGLLLARWAR